MAMGEMDDVLAELSEYLKWKLAKPYGPGMKSIARSSIRRLKEVLVQTNEPLQDLIRRDAFAPALANLGRAHTANMVRTTQEIWREALRWLCRKRYLSLAYELCAFPVEGRNPHDPDVCMRGLAEAWLGVYPKSLLPAKIAASVALNEPVPQRVREDFFLALANLRGCRTNITRGGYWQEVRKLALDLKLQSLHELGTPDGARRLLAHFRACDYRKDSVGMVRVRALFRALAEAELMEDPFRLKEKTPLGARWIIDFSKLQDRRYGRGFKLLRGRRHKEIGGRDVECRLRNADFEVMASYGNPALASWRTARTADLAAIFIAAQENQIARSALFLPPRPTEMRAMNWGAWALVAEDSRGQTFELRNNAKPNPRKHRPDWVVPKVYIEELTQLWELRREVFSLRGDIDAAPSVDETMAQAGVAMWVNPRDGTRMKTGAMNDALRAALQRMGVDGERAAHATLYWSRKGHQGFARSHAAGVGDKFIAENGGHSEEVMRGQYDGPELMARAEHIRKNLWAPLGIVPPCSSGTSGAGSGGVPGAVGAVVGVDDLEALARALAYRDGAGSLENTLVNHARIVEAALKAGLLCRLQSAAAALGVDLRTVERWCCDGHLRPVRVQSDRYLWQAEVNALAQCLSPEEAELHVGLSDRQIRNLVHQGRFPGALNLGKKILIPLTAIRAFQLAQRKGKGFRSRRSETAGDVALKARPGKNAGDIGSFPQATA